MHGFQQTAAAAVLKGWCYCEGQMTNVAILWGLCSMIACGLAVPVLQQLHLPRLSNSKQLLHQAPTDPSPRPCRTHTTSWVFSECTHGSGTGTKTGQPDPQAEMHAMQSALRLGAAVVKAATSTISQRFPQLLSSFYQSEIGTQKSPHGVLGTQGQERSSCAPHKRLHLHGTVDDEAVAALIQPMAAEEDNSTVEGA